MNNPFENLEFLRKISLGDAEYIATVLICAWVISIAVRWSINAFAEKSDPSRRLKILRFIPIIRFLIGLGTIAIITPVLIEPTFQKVVALFASATFVIAFVMKDYASSLMGGIITILENPYQPGDWIEMDGAYGEVTKINLRAAHLLTTEDNEIIIPHYRFWSKKILNATSGKRSLLCIADFYLDPNHDGRAVLQYLYEAAMTSNYRKPESKISVVAKETPIATHYKIKSYVKESREQFDFITDLTIKGKEILRKHNIQFSNAYPAIPLKGGY